MNYEDLYKKYLVEYVKSADLWENAAAVDFEEGPQYKAYRESLIKVRELELALIRHPLSKVFSIAITGYSDSVDHYDIDNAMKTLFGDAYIADSESGALFGFTVPGKAREVEHKLSTIPSLDFYVKDALDIVNSEDFDEEEGYFSVLIPGASNWTMARETLKGLEAK